MKNLILVAFVLLACGVAQAQNQTVVKANNLRFEAQTLNQEVGMAALGTQPHQATFQFLRQSDLIYRCVWSGNSLDACGNELMGAQQAFSVVENYLWNTQQYFPRVYF